MTTTPPDESPLFAPGAPAKVKDAKDNRVRPAPKQKAAAEPRAPLPVQQAASPGVNLDADPFAGWTPEMFALKAAAEAKALADYESRVRRKPEDAPSWFTPEQKQRWADEG